MMTDITIPTELFDAFAEAMAVALGDDDPPRIFTEAEARAAASMFWLATNFARVTVATWAMRENRATKTEAGQLARALLSAETSIGKMLLEPPGDGHSLDYMIDAFGIWTDQVREQHDQEIAERTP